MLLLLGPWFDGSPEGFARLADATGILAYELRSRIRPGCWGLIRAVGDAVQADAFALRLRAEGFPVVLVDQQKVKEPDRKAVLPDRIELRPEQLAIWVEAEKTSVAYRSLMVIVRGDLGRVMPPRSSSSSSLVRPVLPTAAEAQAARESSAPSPHPVADLYLDAPPWLIRLDMRGFEVPAALRMGTGPTRDLDRLVDVLAERAGCRIDRACRMSSVNSFASASPRSTRSSTPPPSTRLREAPPEDPFDLYSRIVAEAERVARELGIISPG